jgi:hypothetical protein
LPAHRFIPSRLQHMWAHMALLASKDALGSNTGRKF